jgi:DNA repair protein RecN (Recombination protein N)
VVTHLPQIAAWADSHVRIAKETRNGRTVTTLRELSATERVAELADMLGAGTTGSAETTARELLRRAEVERVGQAADRAA